MERSDDMSFNYAKLRGKIREVFGSETALAEALGMSRSTMSMKMNGKTEWSQQEMLRVVELLGEPISEVNSLFFAQKG